VVGSHQYELASLSPTITTPTYSFWIYSRLNMWHKSRPVCDCNNCELEALKTKSKLQQWEITTLRESHSQFKQAMQEREERHDKELEIVLRKVNRHSDQIRILGRERQGSRATIQGQNESIPSTGSQTSCEVDQPQQQPHTISNQDGSQALVDTKLKLH
jgi:hypothetical protein